MFLVGAAITAVAFVLAWMLREVPLRKTNHATAEAAAGTVGTSARPTTTSTPSTSPVAATSSASTT